MPLFDLKVRNAKPKAKHYKLTEERGLYLLVPPSGSKLWRFNYRFAGKQKTLALGSYPDVSLVDARARRDGARKALADGIDPAAERKREKAAARIADEHTFEGVAREWMTKRAWTDVTRDKAVWMLEGFLFPWLGTRPVAEIDAPELLSALRRIESLGKLHTAQRVKQRAGQIFRYAVATGRATRDPSTDLRGALKAPKVQHRAAITDPTKVGDLMRAIDAFQGSFVVACALKLSPLLFARPGEVRHAEWTGFDLYNAMWRLPAEKMKMRNAHLVPLSVQAVAILRELQSLTGSGRYVFPSIRGRGRPMSENTVVAALRRLGFTSDEMTAHGFRAMARSLLAELGWKTDAIERQLAHKASGPLGAAYDRAQFLDERSLMMQAWADYLDALRDDRKVVAGKFGKVAA